MKVGYDLELETGLFKWKRRIKMLDNFREIYEREMEENDYSDLEKIILSSSEVRMFVYEVYKEYISQPVKEEENIMPEEKLYIGTKLITARPMDEDTFLLYKGKNLSAEDVIKSRPGYKVTYSDGYVSWSPKETFENAYRKITESEKALF